MWYVVVMSSYPLRIGDRGRIVLPAALRRESGFAEGQELLAIVQDDGSILLESRDRLMNELRAACERMGQRGAIDDLTEWRITSDADRLSRLEQPTPDSAAAAKQGQALLSDLGIH